MLKVAFFEKKENIIIVSASLFTYNFISTIYLFFNIFDDTDIVSRNFQ